MNKQEVMKEINNLPKYYANGACVEFEKVSELIKQLDEPEKPVLTKEEAEWLEGLKELSWLNKYDALYYITRQGLGHGFSYTANGHKVVLETPNKVDDMVDLKARLVNAMLFGHTVEKEKLYTARLKLLTSKKYSFINKDKVEDKLIISGPDDVNGLYQVRFTQAELEGLGVWDNPAFEIKEVEE
ncbi:DUF1642 domain-containing protein [Streptococcus equinus]|uniref:DUF1642 domain-containing protein n=1 Tax=Streptococcus equinus TaxID=1335 RepID=UPI0008D3B8B2|nr:DUF1642 domain-containing protein [Streptococcus equinus]QBX15898.1 hypothetical protein Javan221_0040 [Streptococcus phage Javan221]SEI64358.1 Protein of unknown function [Streptococcus equinus]